MKVGMFNLKRRVEKKEVKKQVVSKAEDATVVKKKPVSQPMPYAKKETKIKEVQISGIYAKGYRLLGKRLTNLFEKLSTLEDKLEKAGKPIPYQAYISGIVLMSLIAGAVGLVVGIVISFLINLQPFEFRFLLPFFIAVAVSQGTFAILYILPSFSVSSRKKKFSDELPYFLGYMSTLASSGLTLEGIFKAITKENTNEEIVLSARTLVRDIDMFGMDVITAIRELIRRSPSESWSELLEGLIATVQTGGKLKDYFMATAKVQMEEKKFLLKKMTASLGVISEMYTILLVVFPLMTVIMLAIMALMNTGGGGLFGMPIDMIMKLVTYLMVPMMGMMVLMMMDGMVPKR